MEVKIGVQHAPRELVLESAQSAEDVREIVTASLQGGAAGQLVLSDEKGRVVIVPIEKLAYIEIGEPAVRKVGFGAL